MSIKFSIIIPVYNVEKYIRQCISSVVNQTYKNIEIILIDDGSTDNCPSICDEFSEKDKRVLTIHKNNGGSSDSRNYGINKATGEYLLFLDSDDYWDDLTCLKRLYQTLIFSKSDVVVFGYKRLIEHRNNLINKSSDVDNKYFKSLTYEQKFEFLVAKDIYTSSACTKAVKRSIIIDNRLFFRKNVTAEDIDWSAKIAVYAKKLDYCSSNFYVYRMRQGSVTTTLKKENLYDIKSSINECVKLGELIKGEKFYFAYMSYVSYQFITLIINTLYVGKNIRKDFIYYIKQNKDLLQYGKHKKIKILNLFYKCFGFNIMYFLLNIFVFLRKQITL